MCCCVMFCVCLCRVMLKLFVGLCIVELMFCFFYIIFDVYNYYCYSLIHFCNDYIISVCQLFYYCSFSFLLNSYNICFYCYIAVLLPEHFWLLLCTFLWYGGFCQISFFISFWFETLFFVVWLYIVLSFK